MLRNEPLLYYAFLLVLSFAKGVLGNLFRFFHSL